MNFFFAETKSPMSFFFASMILPKNGVGDLFHLVCCFLAAQPPLCGAAEAWPSHTVSITVWHTCSGTCKQAQMNLKNIWIKELMMIDRI